MGFYRQEYWSGFPFPAPGDLNEPGINPGLLWLLHAGNFLLLDHQGNPLSELYETWWSAQPLTYRLKSNWLSRACEVPENWPFSVLPDGNPTLYAVSQTPPYMLSPLVFAWNCESLSCFWFLARLFPLFEMLWFFSQQTSFSRSQPTNVHLVKAMVFPVVMFGHESWTIKTAECWRIDAF